MTVNSVQVYQSPHSDDVLHKVFSLLDEFQDTAAGQIYVPHIKEMLNDIQQRYENVEQMHQNIIRQFINLLTPHTGGNPVLRAKFNILKVHLQTPITESDMAFVGKFMAGLDSGNVLLSVDERALVDLFSPAFRNGVSWSKAPAAEAGGLRYQSQERINRENEANLAYRKHLARKTHEIRKLRDQCSRHVDEAIAYNEQFGVLLEIELDALQQSMDMESVEERREVLVEELEKYIKRHRVLAHKFDDANRYLHLMESDNRQLNDELDRVRLLSLTDELTGLPNRRAFMKRLEDEVGRVNRYAYPLSLVLIDLDEFKGINDQYGHAAGDAVLRAYAENVLSAFRHHDMVARYGGEEFAVILPNTNAEGTMYALAKAQEFVRSGRCRFSGGIVAMPTFSAGLAEYIEGEAPAQFIERVDNALYQAKHSGRNRVVMAASGKISKARDSERA